MAHVADSDRVLEGVRYYNEVGVSIDFYVATSLEEAFVRPDYLARSYFRQLS